MPQKQRYTVYFSQINQTKIEVNATGRLHALLLAEKQWRKNYGCPQVMSIDKQDDEFQSTATQQEEHE